jgi:hypothetical protein
MARTKGWLASSFTAQCTTASKYTDARYERVREARVIVGQAVLIAIGFEDHIGRLPPSGGRRIAPVYNNPGLPFEWREERRANRRG